MTFKVPEKFRLLTGRFASTEADGHNGFFLVKLNRGQIVRVIASDGHGWDHVSVSRSDRVPTWDEMCQVKDIFFDQDDVVVQFHPAKADYVNNHQYCLLLWRWQGGKFPTPDPFMIGVPGVRLT